MGKQPIPNPGYGNAGSARDRRVIPATEVGSAVSNAASPADARAAIGAAADVHTHTGDQAGIDHRDWTGSLADSGVRTLQDLANWIDANVRL